MRECPHCRGRYADAQTRCPRCGLGPGEAPGPLRRSADRSLDEGFPPERKRQLILVIVVLDALLFAALLGWFLK